MDNNKKIVIFDMDGVVFDTESKMQKATYKACKKLNIANPEYYAEKFVGLSGSKKREVIIKNTGSEKLAKKYYRLFGLYYVVDLLTHKFPLQPYAKEVLKFLKDNGYTLAVASSMRSYGIKALLTIAGFRHMFSQILGSEDVTARKPDPEVYIKSCKMLGVEPKDCYAVEDSLVGAKAAILAGTKTIIIPDLQQPDEFNRKNAYKVFVSLGDFLNYLHKREEQLKSEQDK